MIRKLKSGQYRLYSRKQDPKTGKRSTQSRDVRQSRKGRSSTSEMFNISSINSLI